MPTNGILQQYRSIEDFDHLFRYAHLMQVLEGKSAETVVKGRTEIAEAEEEHVTQYEPVPDPKVTWPEKAALKQVNEAYNYFSCWQTETDPRLKGLWEQFYRMELEHIQQVVERVAAPA